MRICPIFLLLFFTFIQKTGNSQCNITSTNGWSVAVTITPLSVVPEFNVCPNYYHYEIRYQYSVIFSGSNTGRSFSTNIYFTCSGGTGGTIYQSLGTFNTNTTGTMTTNNRSREYNAISNNNYGSNPSCTQVNLTHVNCMNVRYDYWGSNVVGNSVNCPTAIANPPLPIELLDFGAEPENGKINLFWHTATETNSHYFTVERSKNGVDFEEVSHVNGANNSLDIKRYDAIDENPYSGVSYYRLKQTDYSKKFKYFDMVSVENLNTESYLTNIHPNPAANDISFDFQSFDENELNIDIIDITGRSVISDHKHINSGTNSIKLSLEGLQNGIYFLKVISPTTGYSSTNKIIKN